MTDEHAFWLAERNQVIRAQRIAREEAAETRAYEARRAEIEATRDAQMHARSISGEPVPSVADILSRARDVFEATEAGRDMGAEYGSQGRPALFVTRPDGSVAEVTARPGAGVARSVSEILDAESLARAMRPDPFMELEWERYVSRCKHEASRASDAAVSRAADYDYERLTGPEITRTCARANDGQLRNYGPEIAR